jgi:hypothetical protein
MSPETAVALAQITADVLKAVVEAGKDSPSPSDFAKRVIGIAKDMAPVDELRGYLEEGSADAVDRAVDIAEEAAIAVRRMGG